MERRITDRADVLETLFKSPGGGPSSKVYIYIVIIYGGFYFVLLSEFAYESHHGKVFSLILCFAMR